MDRYGGPLNALIIAVQGVFYISIKMGRYGGPQNALTIDLHVGLYLANIIDRH
jgi:hypothetical protein